MKLSSGVFPYTKFKKENINICLGTDGASSNNSLDLFREMKAGSLLQKINQYNPVVAPAEKMFDLATKNGAKALMIKSGRIKTGYSADLILVDLNQICLVPGYNLVSDLVYSCSGNCVSDLICEGRILMRDKKVPDENEIIKKAKNYGLPKG